MCLCLWVCVFGAVCPVMAEIIGTPGIYPENAPFLPEIVAIANALVYTCIFHLCALDQQS